MDRTTIVDHLEMAERHVREGQGHVERQRVLVSELGRDGHDTVRAVELLQQFEELQALHIADRDRLRGELATLDGSLS